MNGTRHRRGVGSEAEIAQYTRMLSEHDTNGPELDRVRARLRRAINEDITETQRRYLSLYYCEGVNMVEIGQRMGVHKSTVSRTIKRGEDRLRRCLRYGARRLLKDSES